MIVSVFPSVEKRLVALIRMGANKQLLTVPQSASPLWVKALIGSLLVVMAALIAFVLLPLLVMASAMLSIFFTIIPVAILYLTCAKSLSLKSLL